MGVGSTESAVPYLTKHSRYIINPIFFFSSLVLYFSSHYHIQTTCVHCIGHLLLHLVFCMMIALATLSVLFGVASFILLVIINIHL